MKLFKRAPVIMMAVAVLAAFSSTACQPPPKGSNILVFGDSLTQEVFGTPQAKAIFTADYRVTHAQTTRFLTAPCSDLGMNLNSIPTPAVIVINYSGNRTSFGTPCMKDETGTKLQTRYTNDLKSLIQKLKNKWPNTKIVLVASPYMKPAGSNNVYVKRAIQAAADSKKVGFYDGQANIANGSSTPATMPCLAAEKKGEVVRGSDGKGYFLKCLGAGSTNKIREDRLNHFCPSPGKLVFSGRCTPPSGADIYSSGAVRFAYNLRSSLSHAK